MEVPSTSNLVSLETERTATACNFQTMTMNSFLMPHDLTKGEIENLKIKFYIDAYFDEMLCLKINRNPLKWGPLKLSAELSHLSIKSIEFTYSV